MVPVQVVPKLRPIDFWDLDRVVPARLAEDEIQNVVPVSGPIDIRPVRCYARGVVLLSAGDGHSRDKPNQVRIGLGLHLCRDSRLLWCVRVYTVTSLVGKPCR